VITLGIDLGTSAVKAPDAHRARRRDESHVRWQQLYGLIRQVPGVPA